MSEWTRVSGAVKYYKYPECKKGDVLVTGTYLGSKPNKFNAAKEDHEFRSETGELVVLNSAGHLDFLMKKNMDALTTPGTLARITYAGQEKITSGKFVGKEAHIFELDIKGEGAKAPAAKASKADEKAPWDSLESALANDDDMKV